MVRSSLWWSYEGGVSVESSEKWNRLWRGSTVEELLGGRRVCGWRGPVGMLAQCLDFKAWAVGCCEVFA
jgi:hypothetical protein